MQLNELNQDKLRDLAAFPRDGARVLSVYLNLDPSVFPTRQARAVEIHSVIDDAERRLREANGLSHEHKQALAADIERVRGFFGSEEFSAKGAHGLALFCSGPSGLFEVLRLPRPVDRRVVIDDGPFVAPLAGVVSDGTWCVLLVNRKVGRLFCGGPEWLAEETQIFDDVHGQHDQGGWSQARYQRSVEKEVEDHFKNVASAAFARFQRAPFDRLLIGGPEEIVAAFEERLHPYLRDRVAGRIEIDVETAKGDDVVRAAQPVVGQVADQRRQAATGRLREGLAKGGRAVAGLEEVLDALNERRVETLLLRDGLTAAGCTCPRCGWVGTVEGGGCPADGTELDCRDDIIESAIELAISQGAEVMKFAPDAPELAEFEPIDAVLRF